MNVCVGRRRKISGRKLVLLGVWSRSEYLFFFGAMAPRAKRGTELELDIARNQ